MNRNLFLQNLLWQDLSLKTFFIFWTHKVDQEFINQATRRKFTTQASFNFGFRVDLQKIPDLSVDPTVYSFI